MCVIFLTCLPYTVTNQEVFVRRRGCRSGESKVINYLHRAVVLIERRDRNSGRGPVERAVMTVKSVLIYLSGYIWHMTSVLTLSSTKHSAVSSRGPGLFYVLIRTATSSWADGRVVGRPDQDGNSDWLEPRLRPQRSANSLPY